MKNTEIKHTTGNWEQDLIGEVFIEDQAQQCIENAGTSRAWGCVGLKDGDGMAEITALRCELP